MTIDAAKAAAADAVRTAKDSRKTTEKEMTA